MSQCCLVATLLSLLCPRRHPDNHLQYTNHAVLLKALLAIKDPKGRIARWIAEILTYEFDAQHRKGKDNQDADALSRILINNPVAHINQQSAPKLNGFYQDQQDDPEIAPILKSSQITNPYMIKDQDVKTFVQQYRSCQLY